MEEKIIVLKQEEDSQKETKKNKISYTNMKLKVKQDIKTFNFNENEIEVLQYLPIEDKYDLIMVTLQECLVDGIYNPVKIELYFNLNLVYMYTNLSFTEEQKEEPEKIYNTLESNGFISKMLEVFNEDEYNALYNYLQAQMDNYMKYSISGGAVFRTLVNDLPKNAQIAADIVNSFNPEKYKAVTDFAEAANGGRPIN